MKVVFISPYRNAKANLTNLCASIDKQTDDRWQHIIIDDASQDDQILTDLTVGDSRRDVRVNTDRKWALRNIVDTARDYCRINCQAGGDDQVIIATVDADDELCNDDTVRLIIEEYEQNDKLDVLWTAHRWDINNLNVSGPMPNNVDPYEWPWCASHLRTFRASLLKNVSDDNFKDRHGEWFKRGYDQALMLPLLKTGRERKYLDKVCYLYKMDSCSIPLAARPGSEIEQIHNISFIRARGYV